MVNIDKQVTFWRTSALEDWDVARQLVDTGRTRHGLFFVHLAFEKMLKAIVCKYTQDLAPRLHNLIRLSELAGLSLDKEKLAVLAEINAFHIEGRYPETLMAPPSKEEALKYISKAEEVIQWLTILS
ncbi:MAG: HEPN domain-containing protein [Deltaproteobacteria bacterium]|nr:HEPN domain-containing protein [Deltaproteobacteria bacterium]